MHHDLTWFWNELSSCDGDLPRLLELVAVRVAEVVGEASVLTVLSDDGASILPAAVHHPDPQARDFMRELLGGKALRIGSGVAGMVASDRQAVILTDVAPESMATMVSDESRPFVERYPIRSFMIVPLVAFGEVVGTLGAARTESTEPYSDGDLLVLEALAERAALAISDARRGAKPLGLSEYEAIFRHGLDGVLFTMPDGHILAANPAASEILDRTEAEICRLGRAGLVDNDDPRSQRFVAQRAASGRARGEIPMRRADGATFVADVSSTIFSTAEGLPRAVVIFRDVSQQVALREQIDAQRRELERLADQDPLTGLLNRRGFRSAAERALHFAERQREPVQFVFFDIDGLKAINDRFGHRAGDDAIRRVGAAVAGEVRAVDIVARLAGDEFVALLFGATEAEAEEVIDRIRAELGRPRGGGPELSFSAGVAERPVDSSLTIDEMLDAAHRLMYQQKVLSRLERHRRPARPN